MMYSFLIILVIVFLAYVMWNLFTKRKNKQIKSVNLYSHSFGYLYDDNVHEALITAEQDYKAGKNKAANAFTIGEIYQYNFNDQNAALNMYNIAAEEILNFPYDFTEIDPETIIENARLEPQEHTRLREVIQNAREETGTTFTRNVRSDSQNVHDSTVTNDMAKRFNAIRGEGVSFAGISDTIKSGPASHVVNQILSNPSHVTSLDDTDATVLGTVWARIHNPENDKNRPELIKSLEKSLENCYSNGYVVCATGRVSNILDSLTLLDKNTEIAQPVVTTEILRKDVLQHVSNMLEKLPDREKEVYNEGPSHANFSSLVNNLKDRAETDIRMIFNAHSGSTLDGIIDEAKMAID